MEISNGLYNQLCMKSGLNGKALDDYRKKLANMNEEELQREIQRFFGGNITEQSEYKIEHSILEQKAKPTFVDTKTYKDYYGNEVTEYFDKSNELISKVIVNKDTKGNIIESTIEYENGKIQSKIIKKNGNTTNTITYSYSDLGDDDELIIVKNKKSDQTEEVTNTLDVDENGEIYPLAVLSRETTQPDGTRKGVYLLEKGVTEIVENSQKTVSTLYNCGSIAIYDYAKPPKLAESIETKDGKHYYAEFDGKGNTITYVQSGESVENIASKFNKETNYTGVREGAITEGTITSLEANQNREGGERLSQIGATVIIPGEYPADSEALKNRLSKEGAVAQYHLDKAVDKYNKFVKDGRLIKKITIKNSYKDVITLAKSLLPKGADEGKVWEKVYELMALNSWNSPNVEIKKGVKITVIDYKTEKTIRNQKAQLNNLRKRYAKYGFTDDDFGASFIAQYDKLNSSDKKIVEDALSRFKRLNGGKASWYPFCKDLYETYHLNMFPTKKTIPLDSFSNLKTHKSIPLEIFLKDNFNLDITKGNGKEVYLRLASLSQEQLNNINLNWSYNQSGKIPLLDYIEKRNPNIVQDLSKAKLEDISSAVFGMTKIDIRTEEEINNSQKFNPRKNTWENKRKTANMFISMATQAYDTFMYFYNSIGYVSGDAMWQGLKSIANVLSLGNVETLWKEKHNLENYLQKAFQLYNAATEEEFNKIYRELTNGCKYDENNIAKFIELQEKINNGKLKADSEEYKNAVKCVFGSDMTIMDKTQKSVQGQSTKGSICNIVMMLCALGEVSKLSQMKNFGQWSVKTFGRVLGRGVTGAVSLAGWSAVQGGVNLTTMARTVTSEDITNYGKGIAASTGFGLVGGVWGETVVSPVMKWVDASVNKLIGKMPAGTAEALEKVTEKITKLFTNGSSKTAAEVLEAAAQTPGLTAQFIGALTDILGFTLYESTLDLSWSFWEQRGISSVAVKNIIKEKVSMRGELTTEKAAEIDNMSAFEAISTLLIEEGKQQLESLGTIKGIDALIKFIYSGRLGMAADMSMQFKDNKYLQQIKAKPVTVDGKRIFEVTMPDGKKATFANELELLNFCNQKMQENFLIEAFAEKLKKEGVSVSGAKLSDAMNLDKITRKVVKNGNNVQNLTVKPIKTNGETKYEVTNADGTVKTVDKIEDVIKVTQEHLAKDRLEKIKADINNQIENGTDLSVSDLLKALYGNSAQKVVINNIEININDILNNSDFLKNAKISQKFKDGKKVYVVTTAEGKPAEFKDFDALYKYGEQSLKIEMFKKAVDSAIEQRTNGINEGAKSGTTSNNLADDRLSINGNIAFISESSKGIILEEGDVKAILEQSGFSEKSLNQLFRLKNSDGRFNKEVVELLNELKKLGIEENFVINITRNIMFRYDQETRQFECVVPSILQLNDIIRNISRVRSEGADDMAVASIVNAVVSEKGVLQTELVNKNSFIEIFKLYVQFKDHSIAKHGGPWLRNLVEYSKDNSGNINKTNIKFMNHILMTCPHCLSILDYAKDEKGVCYPNTLEMIDYAISKSKEFEPWRIAVNIKYLKRKDGRLDTKNETALNAAIDKLRQKGIKQDKLDYLLDNDKVLNFDNLDAKVDELIEIFNIFGDAAASYMCNTERVYNNIETNAPLERYETLTTIAKWIKNNSVMPQVIVSNLLNNKSLHITPEQIKLIDKMVNYYGRNALILTMNCKKDCCIDFERLFQQLQSSNIPRDVQLQILRCSDRENIKIAQRLSTDKSLAYPSEKIAEFIRCINSGNADFIETVLNDSKLYNILKENLNLVGDKLSYHDIIAILEFQCLDGKRDGNSSIDNETLRRNTQKLNERKIPSSSLFKFIDENPNITAEEVDNITDKILLLNKYSNTSVNELLSKIDGGTSTEKLDLLLDILSIKDFENWNVSYFFSVLSQLKQPATTEQLKLFKEIVSLYKDEKHHDSLFTVVMGQIMAQQDCTFYADFFSNLKRSSMDTTSQLLILKETNVDNIKFLSELCFNNNLNFTTEEILKITQKINNDNSELMLEVFGKCLEKQISKEDVIAIMTDGNAENWQILNHPVVKEVFMENIQNCPSVNSSMSSNNYVEIRIKLKDRGYQQINIKLDSDKTGQVIGTESYNHKKGVSQVELTTDDGSIKLESYSGGLPGISYVDKNGNIIEVQGILETIKDAQGRIVSRTLTKPSKTDKGVLIVIREIYDENGNITEVKDIGSIKHYGNDREGRKIEREFTSSGGTVSKQTIIEGPKGKQAVYEVDGEKYERRHRILDENTTKSTVNGYEYTASFSTDKIEITLIKENGLSEKVTLDNTQLDFQLMPLFKQLPADYLYVLAKTGTRVCIDTNYANNAYFSPLRNEIGISKELANDPFAFSHEFGHMLDYVVLNNLNADPQLKAIFLEELQEYKMQSTRFNEWTISYFVSKDHVNADGCLTEVIAETNAIVDGMIHGSNYLLLRAKLLQENFPKTISYIASRIKDAMRGDINAGEIHNSTSKTSHTTRLDGKVIDPNDAITSELSSKNPAQLAETKVKEEWQQHDLKTKAPEVDEPVIISKDGKAVLNEEAVARQLSEPLPTISGEVTSLIFSGKLGEELTKRYEAASDFFNNVLQKHKSEIQQFAIEYKDNPQAFAQKIVNILCEEFGMKGFESKVVIGEGAKMSADSNFDWTENQIEISDKITDFNQIAELVSHEFNHLLQFADIVAQYGKEGIIDLLNQNKSFAESKNLTPEEKAKFVDLCVNSEYNQKLVEHVKSKRAEEGSLNDYLRRIYSEEVTNIVRLKAPGYSEQLTENEAYFIGKNGKALGITETITEEQFAKLKQENPDIQVTPQGLVYKINEDGTITKLGIKSSNTLIETTFETMNPEAAEKIIYNSIIHNSEENVEKFHGQIYPKSLLSYCEIEGKVCKELVNLVSELLLKYELGAEYKVMTIMDLFKTQSGIDRLAINKFKELSTGDAEKDVDIAHKLKACRDSQGRFRKDYYSKFKQIESSDDQFDYLVIDCCKVQGDLDEGIWAKALELQSLGFSTNDIRSLISCCRSTRSHFEIDNFSDELYQKVLDLKQHHNIPNGEICQIIENCKTKDGTLSEEMYNFAIELSSHIDTGIGDCVRWLKMCENKEELFNRLDEMKNKYGIKEDYDGLFELSCDIIQDGKVIPDRPFGMKQEYTLRINEDKFEHVMNLASKLKMNSFQLRSLIKCCYPKGKFDEVVYNTILKLNNVGLNGSDLYLIGDCIYNRDGDSISTVNYKLLEKLEQWFTSYVEIKSAQEPNKDINIIKGNAEYFLRRMISKINNNECEATEYIQKFIDAGLIDNINEILEVAVIRDEKGNYTQERHYDAKVMDKMISLKNKYQLDSEDVENAVSLMNNHYEVKNLSSEDKIKYLNSLDKLLGAGSSPKDVLEQIKNAECGFELYMIDSPKIIDMYKKYMKQGHSIRTIGIVETFPCPEKYKDNPEKFIDNVLSFINALPEYMQKYPQTLCHLEEWSDIISETVKQNNNEPFIQEYMKMLQYQIVTYDIDTPEFRKNVINILECVKEHPDKLREIETVRIKTGSDYELQEVCLKNIDKYEDILASQYPLAADGHRSIYISESAKDLIVQLSRAGLPIEDALKIADVICFDKKSVNNKHIPNNYINRIVELYNNKQVDDTTLGIIKFIHPYDTKNVEVLNYLLELKIPEEINISNISAAILTPINYIYDNYKEIIDFVINNRNTLNELRQKLSIDEQEIITSLLEGCKYEITNKEDNVYIRTYFCDPDLMQKSIDYVKQGIPLKIFESYCYDSRGSYQYEKIKSLIEFLDKVDLEKYKDEVNLILSETSRRDAITNQLLTKEKWEYILDLQKLLIEPKREGQEAPVLQASFFNTVAETELSDIAINRLRFYIENELSIPDEDGVHIDSLLISRLLTLYTLRPDKIELFEDILFNKDNTNLLQNFSDTKEVLDKQLELYEKLIEFNVDKQSVLSNIIHKGNTLKNVCAILDVFELLRANTNYKNRKKMKDTIVYIMQNTNSLNIEVTKEALNLGYTPEQLCIFSEVNANNKDLIIDWIRNKMFPIDQIRSYASHINDAKQVEFAARLVDEGKTFSSSDIFENLMFAVNINYDLTEFLCLNEEFDFPFEYVGAIVARSSGCNIDFIKRLCADKVLNFPKDLIADIARSTNAKNLEIAERLCTDVSLNIPQNLISDILQNSSGISLETIIKAINTGYLNKYPALAKYPADCWENIVKKNLLVYLSDSNSINKDLVVLYAKSNNYNLIELHNKLVADALLNKDILKSGVDDLNDSEIKRVMGSLKAAQTIDLIGLGNTEAAFPLMIDEFGEFIDEVAELSNKALSHDNVELLRQIINPKHSEKCQKLNDEITELKKRLNEAVGADNLTRIKELQAQKTQIDEQIKQLKHGKNSESPEVKQQIKDLQKQSKALGSQAQSIYYQGENAAKVKEIMKNISNKQKELKEFLLQNSGLEPQEVVTKLRVLYALTEISNEEEIAVFINMIKPSTPENDAVWNAAVNKKIYQKLGVEYDEELSRKLDLIHCKYISKLFVSSHEFFTNMRILVKIIKNNPNLTIEQAIDQMPQNIETKRIFEELGFDYEKFTKVDKNSYASIKIQLNAEEAKQAAIHNLEEDLNDALFQSLPKEVTEPIFKQLKEQLGVTFKKSQRDNWVGDGFSAGTTEYYRLYRDGRLITFEDMNDIVSLIKKEINSNDFWTKTHNNPQIDDARRTMYTHLIKMRTQEVDNALSIKDGETAEIEVRKTDMYDIKNALGLGNDAQCCTALGKNHNEWSAPTYIMNKCIGAIELTDKGNFVGNTMIYLAYVDGKPALVLDNIELKTKYQHNDKIRDTFLDYAKKFCAELGQPDLPIFAGPNRHKLNMDIYDKSNHTIEIIGNSGKQGVYIDYDAGRHIIGQGEKTEIEMYRLN